MRKEKAEKRSVGGLPLSSSTSQSYPAPLFSVFSLEPRLDGDAQ